jgi:PAS domain S-box-containing protein
MMNEATANILVVDDDVKTLAAMEALLSGPGRNIFTASSGTEALRLLLREDFALILMDVRLPVMDGFETAALIRQRERFRYTPIIFISAIDTLESDVFRGAASGAVDYLFKPVVPQILQAKVSVFVDLFHKNEQLKLQAIRQSEERFRLVVESLQDYAVFMMDPSGRVSTWNLGAERIVGWTQQEAIGKLFGSFYTSEDEAKGLPGHALKESAFAGRYEEEGWRLRKDGAPFWANVVVTSLVDDHGELVGFSAVFRDLTGRKKTEEQLKRLNSDLEERYVEKAAELAHTISEREKLQEQLLQVQKMESIGTLAGGIAHDINNILNIISGYANMILQNADSTDNDAEHIEVIIETVERGVSLVRQLLAMARKAETKFEQVRVTAVLHKLQGIINDTFPKEIEVIWDLQPELPSIIADHHQIHQAVFNLCINARDAMPDGGKLIVSTSIVAGAELRKISQEAKEELYCCITVKDTGVGMNESTKNRIFEPFFTTKPQGEGTGLGLAVVYGIIGKHGGVIDVESEQNRGASFRLFLPILKDQPERNADLAEEPRKATERFLGDGETILFVDDEVHQLRLMQLHLQRAGYRVLTAADGVEAVDIHRRHKDEIAAVILDFGLPKLNGWEAFRKMKEIDPAVKAIFATGFIASQLETELAKQELSGVIMKPYQLDEVLEKINSAIKNNDGKPAAEISAVPVPPSFARASKNLS